MAGPYSFAYAGSGGTGSPQTFTVPTTGTFDITGYGGQGGNSGPVDTLSGGKGAEDGGDFSLTAGEKLKSSSVAREARQRATEPPTTRRLARTRPAPRSTRR